MRDRDKIHYIPFTPDNTPGYFTFTEAYKYWCRAEGFRGASPWDHWYLLNMWACDDAAEAAADPKVECPDCSLLMSADGECAACESREWLFT
jgi:hypothetical protein